MEFKNPEFLWLLLVILVLVFFIKQNRDKLESIFDKRVLKKIYFKENSIPKWLRDTLFLISLSFAIVAFARPYINNGEIDVKTNDIDLMVGFDISNSMFCNDIYPNRFEFAKRKFFNLLDLLKLERVGVIAFSQKAFLVSPLTKDFNSLKYLVKNMSLDYVSLKGTSIMSALYSVNNLLKDEKVKRVLIFSDGGDKKSYQKEIEYAKKNHIKVYIYAIATKKGGVIKDKNGVIKDKNGDIVIVKLNEAIKELALESGGAYMSYSLQNDDIKGLVKQIEKDAKDKKTKTLKIKDTKELFIYPLMISILAFILSFISLPRRSR